MPLSILKNLFKYLRLVILKSLFGFVIFEEEREKADPPIEVFKGP